MHSAIHTFEASLSDQRYFLYFNLIEAVELL